MNVQELETLLTAKEGPVEFKEAKERFSFDELTDYCVALANECGGKVILGVTDKRPPIPEALQARLHHLIEQGVVERFGRGKGTRDILSRRFYAMTGRKGVYTRKRGLDRPTNKELLLKHIQENSEDGSRLRDLLQVLPGLTRPQVQTLLREMQKEGSAHCIGKTNAALWYPVGGRSAATEKHQ